MRTTSVVGGAAAPPAGLSILSVGPRSSVSFACPEGCFAVCALLDVVPRCLPMGRSHARVLLGEEGRQPGAEARARGPPQPRARPPQPQQLAAAPRGWPRANAPGFPLANAQGARLLPHRYDRGACTCSHGSCAGTGSATPSAQLAASPCTTPGGKDGPTGLRSRRLHESPGAPAVQATQRRRRALTAGARGGARLPGGSGSSGGRRRGSRS